MKKNQNCMLIYICTNIIVFIETLLILITLCIAIVVVHIYIYNISAIGMIVLVRKGINLKK